MCERFFRLLGGLLGRVWLIWLGVAVVGGILLLEEMLLRLEVTNGELATTLSFRR